MKFDQEYTKYQLDRSLLRKIIRKIYLYYHRSLGKGRCIDFGCGIGELLSILPPGSKGFEVNHASVKYCQTKGLNVERYYPEIDKYEFKTIPADIFSTFYICEVLEHLDKPTDVLTKILNSCLKKGFTRVIVVVPGKKGFAFDPTHKVFIDEEYIFKKRINKIPNWNIQPIRYFPIPNKKFGNYFTYNQTLLVFERKI